MPAVGAAAAPDAPGQRSRGLGSVHDRFRADITKAYAVEGPFVDLGRGVLGDETHPDAMVRVPLAMMNRHGLVAGATGTGKTRTLQVLAEQLSAHGVPCLVADVKGDLSGLADPGDPAAAGAKRAAEARRAVRRRRASRSSTWRSAASAPACRCARRSATSARGCSARSSGPTRRRSRACSSSSTTPTEGAGAAGPRRPPRAAQFLDSDEGKARARGHRRAVEPTVGVLLRTLVGLETGGGNEFFGEPQFDIADLLRTAPDGRGVISSSSCPAYRTSRSSSRPS